MSEAPVVAPAADPAVRGGTGPSSPQLLLLLFGTGLLARVLSWSGTGMFGPDGPNFLFMADWMREGRFHDALALAYHPLYPLLVSIVSLITRDTPLAGYFVSMVLGSAAVIPLFKLAEAFFGRPAAFLTGLLYACSSPLVDVQSDVMTDGTFMFFFLMSAWLTWLMAEAPSLQRAVVLALTASAAFLTRPEGLLALALAVAWPLVEGIRRGPGRPKRAAEVLLVACTILLVLAPFLFWVKAMRGRWGISYRPSAMSVERSVGVEDPKTVDSVAYLGGKPATYRKFGASILRLNLYGALFPFHLLGLAGLKRAGSRKLVFFVGVLLAYLFGVLNTLRKYDGMSDRYLMPAMAWMSMLAGMGLAEAVRLAAARWPRAAWRPAACAALVLAVAVLPGMRCLMLRRQNWAGFRTASDWIRDQGGGGKPMACSTFQINYFAGCGMLWLPPTDGDLRAQIDQGIRFVVYTERDLRSKPELIAMLQSSSRLQPPVRVQVPPGTDPVYSQRVR